MRLMGVPFKPRVEVLVFDFCKSPQLGSLTVGMVAEGLTFLKMRFISDRIKFSKASK